jgi:PilZ domain
MERRRDERYGGDSIGAMCGRVRPGHEIVIVDVSSSGALIEMSRPLQPGARVHVQLKTGASQAAIVARVLRCVVASVSEARIVYRAALQFDHECDWIRESLTRTGYGVHDSASIGSASAGSALPAGVAHFESSPAEPLK